MSNNNVSISSSVVSSVSNVVGGGSTTVRTAASLSQFFIFTPKDLPEGMLRFMCHLITVGPRSRT